MTLSGDLVSEELASRVSCNLKVSNCKLTYTKYVAKIKTIPIGVLTCCFFIT